MEQARVFSNLSIRFVSGPGSGWPKLHWSPISDALLFYRRTVSLVRLSHPPMEQRLWKYIFQCVCSRSVCTNWDRNPLINFFFQVWGEDQGGRRREPSAECLQSCAASFCTATRENWSLPLAFSPKLDSCRPHFDSGRELGSWEPLPAVSLVCISDLLP